MDDEVQNSPPPDDWGEALREKDDLIEALTSQLEQTVEQLDRMRRSGADRGGSSGRGGGAGMPIELLDRLDAMLEQWEETQPHELLLSIDQRLEAGVSSGSARVDRSLERSRPEPKPESAPSSPELPSLLRRDSSPEDESSSEDDDDFWEATKSRLLGLSDSDPPPATEEPAQPEPPPTPEPESSSTAEEETPTDHALVDEEETPSEPIDETNEDLSSIIDLPEELPAPVTLENSPGELLAACYSRDEYIRYLTSKVRQLHKKKAPEFDWEKLNNCPDELRECVEEAAIELADRLKEGELAMSMERADLGRERAKLMQVKAEVEREIQKLGRMQAVAQQNGGAPAAEPNNEKPKKDLDQRLSRFFAREKK